MAIPKCIHEGCDKRGMRFKRSTCHYYIKYCRKHRPVGTRKNQRTTKIGDKYITKKGYVMIKTKSGVKSQHRMVMERKLHRKLKPGESVHHKNGIRHDNSPENLELWIGGIRYGQRTYEIICPHCEKPYMEKDPEPSKKP